MTILKILLLSMTISISYAGTSTKREFTKNGVVYIEETKKEEQGTSSITYPKPGQESTTVQITKTTSGDSQTAIATKGPGIETEVSIIQTKDELKKSKKDSQVFINAIATCSPFKESFPHPMLPGESLVIQVHGPINGKCRLTQTIPGGINTCLFTEAQRKDIQTRGEEALTIHMTDGQTCQLTNQ